jgi:hypothetical protein
MAVPPSAGASTNTFTWTGKAATGSSHNANWSDPANWKGKVAPTAASPVNLTFPPLTCTYKVVNCGYSDNDITGLTVDSLTIDYSPTTYENGSYYITGDGIALGSLTSNGSPYAIESPFLDVPVTLTGSETWKLDGSFLGFSAPISGSGTLTISLAGEAQPSIGGTVSVAALDVVGVNSYATGDSAASNGYFDLQQGAVIDSPIEVKNAALEDYQSTALPGLTTSGASIGIGAGGSPSGSLPLTGPATLDKATSVEFANLAPGVAGTNYSSITSTSTVALGSIQLNLSADCGQPLGTSYTLVAAAKGITGTFREDIQSGNKVITNGTILQAQPAYDGSCTGTNSAPYLQYSYNDSAGTVTASVVAPPPTA